MLMNNIFQMVQAMKNPQSFIQQAMSNNQIMSNPMAKNALNMYQNGDMEGLMSMADNLCKEKGTTVDEVKKVLLSQLGIN